MRFVLFYTFILRAFFQMKWPIFVRFYWRSSAYYRTSSLWNPAYSSGFCSNSQLFKFLRLMTSSLSRMSPSADLFFMKQPLAFWFKRRAVIFVSSSKHQLMSTFLTPPAYPSLLYFIPHFSSVLLHMFQKQAETSWDACRLNLYFQDPFPCGLSTSICNWTSQLFIRIFLDETPRLVPPICGPQHVSLHVVTAALACCTCAPNSEYLQV